MAFSNMEARIKLHNETRTPNEAPRFERPSEYTDWRHKFEDYITLNNPELLVFMKKQYSHSTMKEQDYEKEQKAFATLTMSLSKDARDLFTKHKTSYDLWEAIAERFGDKDQLRKKSPNVVIKEEILIKKEEDVLVKKEEEIKDLHSRILTMENDRIKMRSEIVKLKEQISEFKDQQTEMEKLKADHDLALKTVQDLHEQISKSLKSVKIKKKISTEKSSEPLMRMVREKKISQFTTYSLQKNKKYSEKSQSTNTSPHQKVDCCNDSGYSFRSISSVSRQKPRKAFKPTLPPESGQTKSCVYTRAQMFALAPPRSKHMVQKRRKDFVPFTPIKFNSDLIPRKQFRNETTRFNFRWNSISLDYIDETYRRFSKLKTQIGTVLKWVPKVA